MDIYPEMLGKIVNDSHFDFHVTCKAKVINAVNNLKKGGDFLKALSGLDFKTRKEWLKNSCGDPSVKAMLEILEEYKANEKRPSRAKLILPIIEYAIGLYASDLFYRERGSWFIRRIIEKQKEFEVCKIFRDPSCWYPNTRNSSVEQGPEGNFYKIENDPNAPTIEEEYKTWYNVDINTIEVTPEQKAKIISENQEWVRKSTPELVERMETMIKEGV
jgi:hypothetical protein